MEKKLILGKDQYYSMNCKETYLNNNVLVVGASGAGKTRGLVIPNILEAYGSYIITDPKGNLYQQYGEYLENKGYEVDIIDFSNPSGSAHWNPLKYIRSQQDINKLASMLVRCSYTDNKSRSLDPFWDDAAELLAESLVAFVMEQKNNEAKTLHGVLELCSMLECGGDSDRANSQLDKLMDDMERKNPNSYAVKQYRKFRIAADKTLRSIVISLNARIAQYDSEEIQEMIADDDIDISSLGLKRRALFVVVSDTDRSLDGLVNIFFSQAMNELCFMADNWCNNYELPVPVRFIMDDFATNCMIADFPRMISSVRSRGISVMLMIQAESQLESCYGADYRTIIGNCDSYVYLGGNDVETAKAVAERCNKPVEKVLNMPVGSSWIFRRGQMPINGLNIRLEDFIKEESIAR